jgi:hypothetical protein
MSLVLNDAVAGRRLNLAVAEEVKHLMEECGPPDITGSACVADQRA